MFDPNRINIMLPDCKYISAKLFNSPIFLKSEKKIIAMCQKHISLKQN